LVETQGSFEFIVAQVDQLLADPNYRAIFEDTDEFGFVTMAPYASYEPAQVGADSDPTQSISREVTTVQRGDGGLQQPGETSRTS